MFDNRSERVFSFPVRFHFRFSIDCGSSLEPLHGEKNTVQHLKTIPSSFKGMGFTESSLHKIVNVIDFEFTWKSF